ncbi:MAG: hypothetical protein R8N24_02460 [Alphaproteobacteria bacterium]|nr:hypothetical protein [Alphaproteobacteria bacterium]
MKKKFTPMILSGLIAGSILATPATAAITTETILYTFDTFNWTAYKYPQDFKARFLACLAANEGTVHDMYDLGACCKSSCEYRNILKTKKQYSLPEFASEKLCDDFLYEMVENQNNRYDNTEASGTVNTKSGQTSNCALYSGKPCLPDDLAKNAHATAGRYICKNKTTDTISCAATECESGYYLQKNAKGESQGWCNTTESNVDIVDAKPVPDEVGVAVPKETDEERYERLKREKELSDLLLAEEEARRAQEERTKKQQEKEKKKNDRQTKKDDLEAERKAAKAQGLTLQQYRKQKEEAEQRQQRIKELQQQ